MRMRLSNEAVTSCKAMAMVMLYGAIVLLAVTAARCRDMLQLPCSTEKARPARGCALFSYALKHMATRIKFVYGTAAAAATTTAIST